MELSVVMWYGAKVDVLPQHLLHQGEKADLTLFQFRVLQVCRVGCALRSLVLEGLVQCRTEAEAVLHDVLELARDVHGWHVLLLQPELDDDPGPLEDLSRNHRTHSTSEDSFLLLHQVLLRVNEPDVQQQPIGLLQHPEVSALSGHGFRVVKGLFQRLPLEEGEAKPGHEFLVLEALVNDLLELTCDLVIDPGDGDPGLVQVRPL
mmetsp:Transcript_49881/g.116413  ORF Transcript_49881/g.116413 Transcript_49881/m.116413 type:complete len:205 (-) Transcript_49881:357-971(-)